VCHVQGDHADPDPKEETFAPPCGGPAPRLRGGGGPARFDGALPEP
jgi:hypothetical protein